MAWLSRIDFTAADYLHADDLNNYGSDIRTWGGNVNGGGYTLSNVTLSGVQIIGTGQVTSVFGRSGDVVARNGDYTAAMVSAVPLTRMVNAGAGLSGGGNLSGDITLSAQVTTVFGRTGSVTLTPADISGASGVLNSRKVLPGAGLSGGGPLSADVTLSVVPGSTNQQVQVLSAGALVGTRPAINFINGANVTVSIADDGTDNQVNITVSSTGGSGGMVDPTTTLGDVLVRGATAVTRLGVGANGQVLTADSNQPLGVAWENAAGAQVPSTRQIIAGPGLSGGGTLAADVTLSAEVLTVFGRTGNVVLTQGDITAGGGLVDPTTTKGDIIVHGTTTDRFPVGADTYVLTADSTQPHGMRWALPSGGTGGAVSSVFGRTGSVIGVAGDYTAALVTNAVDQTASYSNPPWITAFPWTKITGAPAFLADPTTTLGDLIVRGSSASTRLAVGANGYVLTADSTQTLGVKWAAASGGGAVSSVFGRTGAVVAVAGDYSASEVTNAVDSTQTYANPTWIGSLAYSKITGAPAIPVSSVFGRTGAVVAVAGDYSASQVTNAADTSGAYANPTWITSLAWSKITGAPAAGQPQSPWAQNVNAANYQLQSAGLIAVGNTGATLPDASSANIPLTVGPTASGTNCGEITACGNLTSGTVGALQFANYNLTATEKRLALIVGATDGANNSGYMSFLTSAAGTLAEKMRITSGGNISVPTGYLAIGSSGYTAGATAGDICISRNIAATNAFIWFGSGGAYISYNGSAWAFNPALPTGITGITAYTNPGGAGPYGGAGFNTIYFTAGSNMGCTASSSSPGITVTFSYVSDERLKQNIKPLSGGLEIVNQIRPIDCEWNGLLGHEKGQRLASISAQELRGVLPYAVSTISAKLRNEDEEETDVLTYDPVAIIMQCVLAIQQLSKRLEEFEKGLRT